MLSYTKTYLNPYEQAKENLQNDELYNELGGNETWTRYAKNGSLDTLLGTINEAKSKMSIGAIRDLPNWSTYDSEHKLQQLAVSLFSDNEKKKDREEITYDAEGNAQRHIVSMTDREYYQKGLDEYASAQREKIKLAQEQAAKDNMNGLQKVVNNTLGGIALFGTNILNNAESMVGFIGRGVTGLYKSIDALISDETEGGKWEAFDNAWREAGEISFSPTEDLRKSIYEWSRVNTDIVNTDGTPASAYNIISMLGDVTGQALTLMAFNFAGAGVAKLGATTSAAKAFTAVGTGIQKAGQVMYWGGMASNNYKELCQDESLASVPTLYLATNAMLRAGAEYAITKGMAKTFGASTLKQLTFNWTPKSGVVSGTKRLINDMLKEGTEEALQEYANQFINTATYIVHSKFGTKASPLQDYVGFSMADMLNAFAAGALVSGLSSSINVLTTKQITTNEVRRDKNGNIIVDKAGEPVMKKFSKWQSWNIIANTKSLMHEIQSFCNDTSKPIEYRETMLGQAVQSFQLLSSFYGNIGQEASERVVSFMQEFAARYTTETNLAYTEQDLTEIVTKIGRELDRLAIKYSMDAAYNFEKAKEELAKKAKEAGITDIVEVHTKKEATATKEEVTPRTTAEEKARAKIDALLLMDNTKTVSISKDGTNSINVEGHRIIPKNMIDSSTDIVADVRKNDASNNFIDNIVNAKELKFAVNEIYNLYKKNYNRPDATINEAVATLLNDGQFYKQALYQTSSVARQMLLQLDKIVDIASGDMITDAMYKQQIANTKKEWQKAVIEYLIIQDNIDESFVTLLTNAQLSYVKSHRYGKDIANRIIDGTVTDADNKVMQTRINSMSISDKKKTELTDNLKSDDRRTRIGAVNYINNYYFGEYRNTFDGKIYPKLDTIGGWKLAQVLLNNNVTLENWLSTPIPNEINESPDKTIENRKAYYKEQFAASTGNQYELNIADNGTYVIHENFAEQSKETGTIVFGGGRETELAKNIVINKVTNNKQYYEQYISKNISDIGKEYYTLTDYIRDPELLSKETKETILDKYGTVTEGTTFLFLRNEILAQTGSVSVVKLNNGEYALADIKPFFDILKNKNFVVTDNIKIEDVIKSKFLTGKLKNIKIVTNSKNGSYYDQDTNTIYLDDETVKDKLYGRYALVHEFQHAIQYMNNISSGIDIDAEYLGYLKPKVRNEILTELRKRIPAMSKFKKGGLDELTFAANFIYRQVTGEWDARGWLGNDIIDRVPMFRRDTAQGPVLDTPWGSYLLDSSKSYSHYKSRKIFDLTDEEKAKLETLTDEEKPGYLEFLKKEKKAKQRADYIAKHKNMVTDANVQPKTPRYVSNKEAEKTNMKYFIRKYKPIQIDYETKNFIEAADPAQINKSIWKMIGGSEKGTLTYQKLMAWVRTIDYRKVNDYTWQLLNKTYFHNPVIKSFRQLNELATSKAGSYYAMWIALRDVGKIDMLSKRIPISKFNELIAETEIKTDSPLSKAYFKHLMSYSKAMEKNTEAKKGIARIVWAENFDGTIESGGRAAGFTYWLILSNYNAPDEKKTTSLNKQIGGDKGDDTEHELIDLIADPNSTKAFDVITGDVKPSQMSAYLKLYLSRKVYVQLDEGSITEEQAEEKTDAILKEVDKLNPDDLAERYFAAKVEDLTGDKTLLKAVSKAREKNKTLLPTRPKKTISDNINRISRNIMNKLSPRELKKAEAEYPEYFKDGKINKEKWQGKNIEEYIAAENILKEIQHKATYGYWNNTLAKEIFTKIEREKLKNEKLKGEKQALKEKVEILKGEVKKYKQLANIKFADSSFDIHSDKPMPEKLKEILDTSFESVSKSEVKFVSTEDDKNMQISMHDFFEANAVTLASINQTEAEEIIDFYAHSTAIEGDITRNDIRKYDAFKIFILANFSDLQITGVYSFDEETNKTLNSLLNTSVSTAATVMNAWSKVVGLTNPSRIIVSNLRKYYGIEVSEDNVNELVKALKMPTTATANKTTEELNKEKIKAIQEALAVIQNEAKSQQLEHKKGDKLWDTLWKIERWAMLSAPGTAIRNAASNIVVDKFGRVAENIGSALFKKSKAKRDAAIDKYKKWKATNPNATEIPKDLIKELPGSYQVQYKQYQIAGTKVDEKTKTFVDKMFDEVLYSKTDNKGNVIKYSFYDTLSEGLSKYFDDKPYNIKGKDNDMQTAANVMAKAIIVKIFGNQMFDTANIKNDKAKAVLQTMNKVSDFTFKWLNDDPWIKKETKRLFGKMLIEDKINLDKGYSTDVLDTLAEAYSLAAYKYMHRTNFINSIEHTIHNKLGAAGYFAFKQIFPFASAGLNWFMEGLNYTPLGLAMGITNYARLESTIEKMEKTRSKAREEGRSSVSPRFAEYLAKQQVGKGILGSIGLLIGLLLGAVGLAAIDEEDDKYKLRIGTNTYIDISDIFGTQGILSGIAIASLFGDDSNSFWDVMKGTFNNLFEDFVFNDLYSNIQYSNTLTDYLITTTENAMLSFIPNFLKAFNRNLYTFTPQYSNNKLFKFLQKAGMQAIPGLAYALPKKIDIYTGKVESKYNLPFLVKFINSNSPIDIAPYNVSSNEKEALLQGVNKSYLTGRYDDIGKLDSNDIVKLNKKYGELNDKSLSKLFAGKEKYKVQKEDGTYVELSYNKMTQKQKKSVIQRIMSDNALYAKVYVYTSNGGKYYTSEDEYKTLKKLGISNVYIATSKKKGFN